MLVSTAVLYLALFCRALSASVEPSSSDMATSNKVLIVDCLHVQLNEYILDTKLLAGLSVLTRTEMELRYLGMSSDAH